MHLASMVFDTPLAIMPEKLEAILGYIGPRLTVDQAAIDALLTSGAIGGHYHSESDRARVRELIAYWDHEDDDTPSSSGSSSSANDRPYDLTEAGIAVIPVRGSLMKRGGWMSALSGCTSYSSLSKTINYAMSDSACRGVLFDIDSPGGSTHGCFELADMIHSARGTKPMFAAANDLAASAAYALASAADRVYVTRTGGVGSVGVFALHVDRSGADEQYGYKYTYIHFGSKKVDGNEHEPLSRSALKDIQAEVDREGEMFVATVARNRGVKASRIADTDAALLFAEGAIPLLADAVGTYEDALDELTAKIEGVKSLVTLKADATMSPENGLSADTSADTSMSKHEPDDEQDDEAKSPKPGTGDGEDEEDDADEDDEDDMEKEKKAAATPATTSTTAAVTPDPAATTPVTTTPATTPAPAPAPAATSPTSPASAPAAAYPYAEVAELCTIAGCPERAAGFVLDQVPLAEVRKQLREARATQSAANGVNPNFGAISTSALEGAIRTAHSLRAGANGALTMSAAIEQTLRANPQIYEQYEEERYASMVNPIAARRYGERVTAFLAQLNLSTVR